MLSNKAFVILILITYMVVLITRGRDFYNSKSPLFYFILSFGFFYLTRFPIYLYSEQFDFTVGSWIYWGKAPDAAVQKSLMLIETFLLAILAFKTGKIITNSYKENVPLFQISTIILLLSAPFYLIKNYMVYTQIGALSYLDTFTGDIKAPFIVNIFSGMFQVSILTLLTAYPNKRKFYLILVPMSLIVMTSLGTGQRTEFLLYTILILYYLRRRGFFEISVIKLLGIFFLLMFISVKVNIWRMGSDSGNFLSELLLLYWGQGATLFTVFGVQEYPEIFNPFEGWFFWNKFISCDILPYFNGEFCHNGEVAANTIGIWWQKLSYFLDPVQFQKGAGLGGSLISSIYLLFNTGFFLLDIGMFFIFCYLFIWISEYISSNRLKSVTAVTYQMFFCSMLFFSSRAGLDTFIPHPRMIVSFLCILLLYHLFKNISEKNEAKFLEGNVNL